MNTEKDELSDRIAYLEHQITGQTGEIECLKSALADCLRRVKLLETSRGMRSSQHAPASSRTSSESRASKIPSSLSPQTLSSAGRSGDSRISAGSSTINSTRRTSSQNRPNKITEQARSPCAAPPPIRLGGVGSQGTVARPPTGTSKSGTREPSFLKDDGILKMYLRGRCLNVYAPTDVVPDYEFNAVQNEPDEQLKLEWVYGYRGKDCRNNLLLLPTGEVIYFIAATVVLYNIEQHSQRHYLEHTDDVKSIALHPDRITVASGQVAGHAKTDGKAHVRIWNSVSLETLHVIGLGMFENSVACLNFSKTDGGATLAVIDDATDHTVSLWDWQKSRRLTENKTSGEPVLAVEFSPLDANSLVSIGKNHIAFWTLDGSTLTKRLGVFDKYEKPKFVLSMVFAENGDLITGDSNGSIFVWPRGAYKIAHAVVGVHSGGIFALSFTKDGHLISGGGKDYRVVQLDANYEPTGVSVELAAWYGPVRTLTVGPGDMLIVGTTQGNILMGNLETEFSPLIQGHSDEFWALAAHPQTHHFLTSGRDGNVFMWDSLTKSLVWAENLSEEVISACFYPAITSVGSGGSMESPSLEVNNGRLPDTVPVIAIGTASGRWIVLDAVLHQVIAAHHESSEAIQCIAYSPNGQFIAIGCRDNYIYVYNVLERGTKYTRLGKCSGHSSFVLHLDWSEDSQYLRSTSGDYELLFWFPANCRQLTSSSSMRDVRWVSQHCHLGFQVAGIWPPGSDGTDVNAVTRSHSGSLLATADDFGRVNLFRYPVSQLKSNSRSYNGHSSHVTNVDFLFDDSRLISSGGADTAIMQWEVIY